MKISKNRLRQIILEEMIQYLEEGRQEKNWIAQQPEEEQEQWLSAEQQGLKLSDLAWIKKVRGGEPIQDIVGDVLYFRKQDVQKKLKSNGFETNLSKKTYPTVNDLRRLIKNVSDAQESDVKYDEILRDPSQVELLGKVGNYEILFPLTQRGSIACDISGEDTTWCTTKSQGQNLFYSYLSTPLIYIVDYTRTPNLENGNDADARLSVGFMEDGTPILEGRDGFVSVDALNRGLTEEKLRNIFGNDYEEIMTIASSKVKEIGGNHPAKVQLEKASQNIMLLKKMVQDYGAQEKFMFFRELISKSPRPSVEVQLYIYKNMKEIKSKQKMEDEWWNDIGNMFGYDTNVPEILKDMYENNIGLQQMSSNEYTPPEVLGKMLTLADKKIVDDAIRNPSTPMLELLRFFIFSAESHPYDLEPGIRNIEERMDELTEDLQEKVVDETIQYSADTDGYPSYHWNVGLLLNLIAKKTKSKKVLMRIFKLNYGFDAQSGDYDAKLFQALFDNPLFGDQEYEELVSNVDISRKRRILRFAIGSDRISSKSLRLIANGGFGRMSLKAKEKLEDRGETVQESKLKISKSQLKQIILEEVLKTLNK